MSIPPTIHLLLFLWTLFSHWHRTGMSLFLIMPLFGLVAFPTSKPTVSVSAQHLQGVSGGVYATCPARYMQLNLRVHLAWPQGPNKQKQVKGYWCIQAYIHSFWEQAIICQLGKLPRFSPCRLTLLFVLSADSYMVAATDGKITLHLNPFPALALSSSVAHWQTEMERSKGANHQIHLNNWKDLRCWWRFRGVWLFRHYRDADITLLSGEQRDTP